MAQFYTDEKGKKRPITSRKYRFPIEKNKVIFTSNDLSLYHTGRMKHAVDIIITPVGSKVHAARPGVVSDIIIDRDGNKNLEITHSGGEIADYGHLDDFLVKEGQEVKEDEVIALSGDTGDLAGLPPHLNFEVDGPIDGEYHSIPFEWKESPETEDRTVHVMINKPVYDKATKKRRDWDDDRLNS